MTIFQKLLERVKTHSKLIKNIITGDETWIYGYNVEKKRQSSKWKSENFQKPKFTTRPKYGFVEKK